MMKHKTAPTGRKAVFLDRDGVINPLVYHQEAGVIDSPFTLAQFCVARNVPRAIRELNRLGFLVVVVSNQPGIAKGHFTAEVLQAFDRILLSAMAKAGARIDAIYYCLHHPEAKIKSLRKRCACRKPAIGMLKAAARRFGIALEDSYMIGDSLTDVATGRRAGCKTIFIGRWKCEVCQMLDHPGEGHPQFVAKDLWAASKIIREEARNGRNPKRKAAMGRTRRRA